jgi:hypothetical protein
VLGAQPGADDRGVAAYLLEEPGVVGRAVLVRAGEHRQHQDLQQRPYVVGSAVRLVLGEQRQAVPLHGRHPAFDDRLDQAVPRSEVVVHGGVVALAGGDRDVPQRHGDAALGDQSLRGEDDPRSGIHVPDSNAERLSH